jgi:hypothetical protein
MRKATVRFVVSDGPSVRPSICVPVRLRGTPGLAYFSKACRENQSLIKIDKNNGTLHEDVCTFMISRQVLRKMKNASDQSWRENENTHFTSMFNNFSCHRLRRLWDNVKKKCCRAGEATDGTVTQRMRVACLISRATNTYSEYAIMLLHSNSDYAIQPQCYVVRLLLIAGEVTLMASRALWLVKSSLQEWNAFFTLDVRVNNEFRCKSLGQQTNPKSSLMITVSTVFYVCTNWYRCRQRLGTHCPHVTWAHVMLTCAVGTWEAI